MHPFRIRILLAISIPFIILFEVFLFLLLTFLAYYWGFFSTLANPERGVPVSHRDIAAPDYLMVPTRVARSGSFVIFPNVKKRPRGS